MNSPDSQPRPRRLLSIGTDRLLFKEGSAVRERILGYAKGWDEMHIVVASSGDSYKETSIGSNVWVYPTRSWAKALYPLDAARIGRFIARRRGATEITCQDPFLTAMAGVRLQKELGLPLELQVHTDIGSPHFTYSLANKVRKALALSYLPKADRIRVVSDRIREYLVSQLGIDAEKIEVRPIAVDVEAVKRAPITPSADLRTKYPQFRKIVLVASRLEPEKNVRLAIEAWTAVARELPGTALIIVGSGSQAPSLRRIATKSPAAASIVFEPWADRQTLFSYYKTADLFLNTSLFEGYGMALVEAAAAGCKIASTDVGIARETGAAIIPWDAAGAARGIIAALGV